MFKKLTAVFTANTWRRLIVAFVTVIGPVFLFVALADEVREQDTLTFDEAVLRAVNSVQSPFLDATTAALTQLGGVVGVLVLAFGGAALLWTRHKRKKAVILVLGVAGATLLNTMLKTVFQRDRPQLWERIVTENSFSFPSGHAMVSSALALSIIVIFWSTRWRLVALVSALLYMVTIALTRLYLGVHYPTDIVAAWVVSSAWIGSLVIALNYRTWVSSRKQTKK